LRLGYVHSAQEAVAACKAFAADFNASTYPEGDCNRLLAASKAVESAAKPSGGAGGSGGGGSGGETPGKPVGAGSSPFAQDVFNGQALARGGAGSSRSTPKAPGPERAGAGAAGASSSDDMDEPDECVCGRVPCMCASETARKLMDIPDEGTVRLTSVLHRLCLAVNSLDGPMEVLAALAGHNPGVLKEIKWGACIAYKVVTEMKDAELKATADADAEDGDEDFDSE
jgi:hypothetical protein